MGRAAGLSLPPATLAAWGAFAGAMLHGETAWNVENRIQGQLDVPLNDRGRWQAQRLAQAMSGEALDAIYTSDLLRTVETAAPTVRGRAVGHVTDSGLRERGFGVFEGMIKPNY